MIRPPHPRLPTSRSHPLDPDTLLKRRFETRPAKRPIVSIDQLSVHLNDLTCDEEAKTHAVRLARKLLVKNPFPVLFGDARAVVREHKPESAFELRKADLDLSTFPVTVMTGEPIDTVIE